MWCMAVIVLWVHVVLLLLLLLMLLLRRFHLIARLHFVLLFSFASYLNVVVVLFVELFVDFFGRRRRDKKKKKVIEVINFGPRKSLDNFTKTSGLEWILYVYLLELKLTWTDSQCRRCLSHSPELIRSFSFHKLKHEQIMGRRRGESEHNNRRRRRREEGKTKVSRPCRKFPGDQSSKECVWDDYKVAV